MRKQIIILLVLVGILISAGGCDKKRNSKDKTARRVPSNTKWEQEKEEQRQWEQEVGLLGQRLKREREERMRERGYRGYIP